MAAERERVTEEREEDAAAPPAAVREMSAEELERTHVHEVYEAIAPHFSHTRYGMWPRVAAFLCALPHGSAVLDVGAGNGKYLGANPSCFAVGCDMSAGLAGICRARGHEAVVADALRLPFRAAAFDAAVCIAVLHHLATPERRVLALEEMARTVRPGGTALVYVWSFERGGQKKGRRIVKERTQDTLVRWNMPRRYEHEGMRDGPEPAEVEGRDEVQYERYYHMFREGELEELVGLARGLELVEGYYDHQNWAAVVRRCAAG